MPSPFSLRIRFSNTLQIWLTLLFQMPDSRADETKTGGNATFSECAGKHFPKAKHLPFGSFNNKYAEGACYVIGRGVTEFNYTELSNVKEPVFFINDAICLEKHTQSETFFFAHDDKMFPWLNREIKAAAILPADGKLFKNNKDIILNHVAPVVLYHWRRTEGEKLLKLNRDELAIKEELYTHTGTMHSLLHFLWFCGFKTLNFVGCDGIADKTFLKQASGAKNGYDQRLENLSKTSPWWQYETIRRVQDRLCGLFNFDTIYLGTPREKKVNQN